MSVVLRFMDGDYIIPMYPWPASIGSTCKNRREEWYVPHRARSSAFDCVVRRKYSIRSEWSVREVPRWGNKTVSAAPPRTCCRKSEDPASSLEESVSGNRSQQCDFQYLLPRGYHLAPDEGTSTGQISPCGDSHARHLQSLL